MFSRASVDCMMKGASPSASTGPMTDHRGRRQESLRRSLVCPPVRKRTTQTPETAWEMTVASTVMQMVWIPVQGIGQGAQPIISYNYGAKNPQRVREAFWALLKLSCALMAGFWLLVQLFPQLFIRIFNDNPALIETAMWTLRLYTAVLGLFGIQMSVQQTFMAIGKAKASLFIACLRKVILLIPLIFLLPQFFTNKVFAVFLAEPVSDLISVAVSAVTFYRVFRPEMAALERRQAEGGA